MYEYFMTELFLIVIWTVFISQLLSVIVSKSFLDDEKLVWH